MSSRRCAVHPARPAHDDCPVCARPRCQADAEALKATGCLACVVSARPVAPAGRLELAVRAGLAGIGVAYVGGWIATQYVRVHVMSLVAPAVVGLAASWAVFRAGARLRPSALAWGIAAVAALLGTALGFVLTPGGQNPLRDWAVIGGPYLAALVGVALGPLVFGVGPRSRRPDDGDQPPGDGDGDAVGTSRYLSRSASRGPHPGPTNQAPTVPDGASGSGGSTTSRLGAPSKLAKSRARGAT